MTLLNIQAMRAYAAVAVLGFHLLHEATHYIGPGRWDVRPRFLSAGVDVFFVISGYIMIRATRGRNVSPGKFWLARFVRVVPSYWLLTFVVAAALAAGLNVLEWREFSLSQLILSCAFIPPFDADPSLPLVLVGWSLNYEMFFYLLFGLALTLGTERTRVLALLCMLGMVVLAGQGLDNRYLAYYGAPLVLQFAMGVGLSQLSARHFVKPRTAYVIGVVALLGFAATEAISDRAVVFDYRAVLFGIPATLLVYCALALEQHGQVASNKWIQFFGDASYSLYLIHPLVLQTVRKALATLNPSNLVLRDVAMFGLGFAGSLIAAALFFVWIERPTYTYLKRALTAPRAPVPQPAEALPLR